MPGLIRSMTVAALFFGPAVAGAQTIGVEHPWSRATAPMARAGAAFMSVTASADDAIIAAQTPVAGRAELHVSTHNESGVMSMHPVDRLPLPAGEAVTLAPGGLHVMLFDLAHPLAMGDSFPLTLTFAHAAPLTVEVKVEAAGAMPRGHGQMQAPGNMGNMPPQK